MAIKIISETPITMSELKNDLKKIKERDSELNFRAQKTEEYLNMFVGLGPESAKELSEKIDKLNIPRFKPEHIAKVVDILPQTVEEAKLVLSAYPITVTNDNLKKIVDAVKPFAEQSSKEAKKVEAQLEKERKEAEIKAEQERAEVEKKVKEETEAEKKKAEKATEKAAKKASKKQDKEETSEDKETTDAPQEPEEEKEEKSE